MPKTIQKTQDNSKYQRINTLYQLLSNATQGYTIGELATQLDVSTKTIQRDLYEVLGEFGAVKDGRYWKIDAKAAEDHLGAQERIILGILDEMAKAAGKSFYSKAHSLLAQVSQQLEHPIFTGINSESLNEQNIELFEQLEIAIKKKIEVSYSYQNKSYEVKPLKLVYFEGFWYLLALDSLKKDTFKKFHLKTIKNLKEMQKVFDISTALEQRLKGANSVWFNLEEPFEVRLLIDKQIRKYFERKPFKGQSVMGEDSDGSLEIEIKITHEMEILPVIFWYIPHIKVLSPDWIADIVKEKVSGYIDEIK